MPHPMTYTLIFPIFKCLSFTEIKNQKNKAKLLAESLKKL